MTATFSDHELETLVEYVTGQLEDEGLRDLLLAARTNQNLLTAVVELSPLRTALADPEQRGKVLGIGTRPQEPEGDIDAISTPPEAEIASMGPTGTRSWTRPTRVSWTGIAATVMLTVAAGGYAGFEWRRSAAETALLRGALAQRESRISDLQAKLEQANSRQTAAETIATFSLGLSPGARRTGGENSPQVLQVPQEATLVAVLVDLGARPGSLTDRYELVINSPDQPQEWRSLVRPELREGRYIVAASLRRSLLPDGDYQLAVERTPPSNRPYEVASTPFKVVAQRHSP